MPHLLPPSLPAAPFAESVLLRALLLDGFDGFSLAAVCAFVV